MEKKLKQR